MRVVAVDDELYIRQSLVDELQAALPEAEILACESAGQVLDRLEKEPGIPVDLVFTDNTMRGMSGVELAVRLNREYPDIQVFLITGESNRNLLQQGVPLERCIMKPVTAEAIAEKVSRLENLPPFILRPVDPEPVAKEPEKKLGVFARFFHRTKQLNEKSAV